MHDKENYISRGIKLDLDFVPLERNGKYFLLMKKTKIFFGHNFVANSGFEIPNFE